MSTLSIIVGFHWFCSFIAIYFQVLMVGSEIGRLPPTFNDAAKVANAILTSGYEYDTGKLLFNYYKSVVSNETTELPIYSQGMNFWFSRQIS